MDTYIIDSHITDTYITDTYNIASGPLSLIVEYSDVYAKYSLGQTCMIFNKVIDFDPFTKVVMQIDKLNNERKMLGNSKGSTYEGHLFKNNVLRIFEFPIDVVSKFFYKQGASKMAIRAMINWLQLDIVFDKLGDYSENCELVTISKTMMHGQFADVLMYFTKELCSI
jgi:hypothetical protein